MIAARSGRVAVFALVLAVASVSRAQPLVDRGFDLDVLDLPVLGSSRAVGLGGAFASAGNGTAALGWNPAAAATRSSWEDDWFEWELAFGVLFPTTASANSFFGATGADALPLESFSYYDAGFRLQFGPAGFGVLIRPRRFEFGDQLVTALTGHVDLAWSLFGGDLVVGAGFRVAELGIDRGDTRTFEAVGVGFEAGATYLPRALPFRAALAFRSPMRASHVDGGLGAVGFALPEDVVIPWEIVASGTYGFGEQPVNVHPSPSSRPRERRREERRARDAVVAMMVVGDAPVPTDLADDATIAAEVDDEPIVLDPPARRPRYGFVTFDLVLAGRVPRGIGLDGFLTQTERPWGRRTSASPRLGVEGEPWRDRMKLRTGLYLEPHRSERADPRVHFTHGFDLRLFETDVFGLFDDPIDVQLTWVADVAKEYVNLGVGVGLWH